MNTMDKILQGIKSGAQKSSDKSDKSGNNDKKNESQYAIGSSEAVDALKGLSDAEFYVSEDDIWETFFAAVKSIPKKEAYLTKEVVVRKFTDETSSLKDLLAAGTSILDAIIYIALGSNDEFTGLFDIVGPISVDPPACAQIRSSSFKLLKAAIEHYFTKGVLPGMGGEDEPLSKNIKTRTLAGLGITTGNVLGTYLSSAALHKFPREVMLHIKLDMLDSVTAQRIMLSPAATKFHRYFVIVNLFKSKNGSKNEKAKAVFEVVKEMKPSDLLMFHPDQPYSSQKVGQMSLKITAMLFRTLSEDGISKMLTYIQQKKMEALMKDGNVYTVKEGKVTCPLYTDVELNDDCITPVQIKEFLETGRGYTVVRPSGEKGKETE